MVQDISSRIIAQSENVLGIFKENELRIYISET